MRAQAGTLTPKRNYPHIYKVLESLNPFWLMFNAEKHLQEERLKDTRSLRDSYLQRLPPNVIDKIVSFCEPLALEALKKTNSYFDTLISVERILSANFPGTFSSHIMIVHESTGQKNLEKEKETLCCVSLWVSVCVWSLCVSVCVCVCACVCVLV